MNRKIKYGYLPAKLLRSSILLGLATLIGLYLNNRIFSPKQGSRDGSHPSIPNTLEQENETKLYGDSARQQLTTEFPVKTPGDPSLSREALQELANRDPQKCLDHAFSFLEGDDRLRAGELAIEIWAQRDIVELSQYLEKFQRDFGYDYMLHLLGIHFADKNMTEGLHWLQQLDPGEHRDIATHHFFSRLEETQIKALQDWLAKDPDFTNLDVPSKMLAESLMRKGRPEFESWLQKVDNIVIWQNSMASAIQWVASENIYEASTWLDEFERSHQLDPVIETFVRSAIDSNEELAKYWTSQITGNDRKQWVEMLFNQLP